MAKHAVRCAALAALVLTAVLFVVLLFELMSPKAAGTSEIEYLSLESRLATPSAAAAAASAFGGQEAYRAAAGADGAAAAAAAAAESDAALQDVLGLVLTFIIGFFALGPSLDGSVGLAGLQVLLSVAT
eukprot:TRINITY_DN73682_c0_g1_i1.p2 TRINITY_DN73682_c0_g1~~TRINITY_DN73682_c0_g1_i1.p2  ORF type:complete len:129 (+),score=33.30 TRINITY_DN73682_c0_g1_i1:70-456(+)